MYLSYTELSNRINTDLFSLWILPPVKWGGTFFLYKNVSVSLDPGWTGILGVDFRPGFVL